MSKWCTHGSKARAGGRAGQPASQDPRSESSIRATRLTGTIDLEAPFVPTASPATSSSTIWWKGMIMLV